MAECVASAQCTEHLPTYVFGVVSRTYTKLEFATSSSSSSLLISKLNTIFPFENIARFEFVEFCLRYRDVAVILQTIETCFCSHLPSTSKATTAVAVSSFQCSDRITILPESHREFLFVLFARQFLVVLFHLPSFLLLFRQRFSPSLYLFAFPSDKDTAFFCQTERQRHIALCKWMCIDIVPTLHLSVAQIRLHCSATTSHHSRVRVHFCKCKNIQCSHVVCTAAISFRLYLVVSVVIVSNFQF